MKLLTSSSGLLPILGIASTALAVGFGTGRLTSPAAPSPQSIKAPVISEHQELRTLSAIPPTPVPAADTNAVPDKKLGQVDLKKIMANADARERAKELDALLASSDEPEVKQLLDWVTAMPDGPEKRVALGKVMKRWGELDGSAAAAYGIDSYQQTGNSSLLRNALLGWAQADPASSMQYLQGLGLGHGLANDFTRDILGVWSNTNPQAAAAYLQANPSAQIGWSGGGFGRGGGAWGGPSAVVAGNWAAQDPQAAANWALSLPAGPQQGSAMNQVLQNWVAQDPNAAVAFVNSQPAGPGKDGMVSSLARGLAADDPTSAIKWVSTIGNEGMQTGTVMGILGQAGVFGPNGPDTTLAQSLVAPLPQNVQQQIMQRVTNRGGPWGGGGGRGNAR
jgi:hypothetical protein